MNDNKLLNAQEAADLVGVTKQTIYNYCSNGKKNLPHIKKGNRVFFIREVVLTYFEPSFINSKT